MGARGDPPAPTRDAANGEGAEIGAADPWAGGTRASRGRVEREAGPAAATKMEEAVTAAGAFMDEAARKVGTAPEFLEVFTITGIVMEVVAVIAMEFGACWEGVMEATPGVSGDLPIY